MTDVDDVTSASTVSRFKLAPIRRMAALRAPMRLRSASLSSLAPSERIMAPHSTKRHR